MIQKLLTTWLVLLAVSLGQAQTFTTKLNLYKPSVGPSGFPQTSTDASNRNNGRDILDANSSTLPSLACPGVSEGDVVFVNASSEYQRCDASAVATARVNGLVWESLAGSPPFCRVRTGGDTADIGTIVDDAGQALVVGTDYFCSAAVSGKLTATEPVNSVLVGTAVSTTNLGLVPAKGGIGSLTGSEGQPVRIVSSAPTAVATAAFPLVDFGSKLGSGDSTTNTTAGFVAVAQGDGTLDWEANAASAITTIDYVPVTDELTDTDITYQPLNFITDGCAVGDKFAVVQYFTNCDVNHVVTQMRCRPGDKADDIIPYGMFTLNAFQIQLFQIRIPLDETDGTADCKYVADPCTGTFTVDWRLIACER